MDVPTLLTEWLCQIRVEIGSHYEAARRYEAYNSRLGYPTVILSAITGTAISSLADSPNMWLRGSAIGASILVTILTSLAAFTQFSARASAHKVAATELGKLSRDIEVDLALGEPITRDMLDDFRNKRDELGKSAPTIPDAIFQRHRIRAEKKLESKPVAKQ